jgi:glycosyltransferase involved in cell wall biosynthesis
MIAMSDHKPTTAILHYTAPPVVGGVEAVMDAHARIFLQMGYPVSIIAGQGAVDALPPGCELQIIPELNSLHPDSVAAGKLLEVGTVPDNFSALTRQIRRSLAPLVSALDNLIVHNVFTKHFNLPLTAALFDLLNAGQINHCIAWHHDFTWTSPRSRSKVHPGYPWDLLRTYRPDMTNVTISQQRRDELAGLYGCPQDAIRVIYNGVDAAQIFGLSVEGSALVKRLDLLRADLLLLMPVRVTKAKNIEYALQVVAALKAAGVGVKLVLTGPPDPHDEKSMAYFRSLQEQRDQLGLQEEMHFVFESGPDGREPYPISLDVVFDLYRVADLVFMPSHQEGFGMPVLEAGLLALPVVAADTVPAAVEIGGDDVLQFDLDKTPRAFAEELLPWVKNDSRLRLARCTRQDFTWEAIFAKKIEPLLWEKQRA